MGKWASLWWCCPSGSMFVASVQCILVPWGVLYFCPVSQIPNIFLTVVHRCSGLFWPIPLHILHSLGLSLLSRFRNEFQDFVRNLFWRPWWHFWKPWREDDGRWGTAAHRVSRYRGITWQLWFQILSGKEEIKLSFEESEQSNVFEEIVCGKPSLTKTAVHDVMMDVINHCYSDFAALALRVAEKTQLRAIGKLQQHAVFNEARRLAFCSWCSTFLKSKVRCPE